MTNKKQEAKRLGIYLLIVFAVSLSQLIFMDLFESKTVYTISTWLFNYSPAIACLVTRAVTKEGFRGMKLHLRVKGNIKYYMTAIFLPFVYTVPMVIIPTLFSGYREQMLDRLGNLSVTAVLMSVLTLVGTLPFAFGLICEELGWRAYMNDKLEIFFGTSGTCIIGGIIWGAWHFPPRIASYLNNGMAAGEIIPELAGQTFLCVFEGIMLCFITKKTGTVWPAVFMHYFSNNIVVTVSDMLVPEYTDPDKFNVTFVQNTAGFIPMAVIAVIFLFLLVRDRKPKTE